MNKRKWIIGLIAIAILCILIIATLIAGFYLAEFKGVKDKRKHTSAVVIIPKEEEKPVTVTGDIISETQKTNDKKVTTNQDNQTASLPLDAAPMLEITNIDVKFDSNSEKNLENGDTINDAKPGNTIEFSIEVTNNHDRDEGIEIEDIIVTVTIEEIDDGNELEEESKSFDLDAGKDKTVKISFNIPWEVGEDNFGVIIEVKGEDGETGEDHKETLELELEIDKENHKVKIINANLDPSVFKCNREAILEVVILNIGAKEEDGVSVTVENQDLEVDIEVTGINIDNKAFDDDSKYKLTETITVSENIKPSIYPLTIKSYYDNNRQSDTIKINLEVQECEEGQTGFTIIDDYGRAVTIPKYPQRIISLAPSITEILYNVQLGNNIIGVDDYSDYPEEAEDKTKIGSYLMPNLEIIISLNPDLILASDMTSKDNVITMEEKGLTVVVLAPETVTGIIQDIRLVGLIGNKTAEANNLADNLEQRIDAVTSKTSDSNLNRPKVYMEYYPYWTYGPGSFGNDMILMAGGKNIAATTATAYSEITNEFVVASNPEIIIFTVGPHASTTVEDIKSRTGWVNTDAVESNNIYTIDDDIISRPGPRIVDALEQLAELIHPDLFP